VKIYLYAVGLVMALGLVMPFDASAGTNCAVWRTNGNTGKAECAVTAQNNSGTTGEYPNDGSYVDPNGNNNSGNNHNHNNNNNQGCGGFNQQQCDWPGSGQPMSPWQYQQVKATGRDAMNIILNSDMLASGQMADGGTRYTVRYTGTQYSSLQGVVFNCKVSPNGRDFECVNWLPPKPKQVQIGNGWEIIFELLNQYQQKKNQ